MPSIVPTISPTRIPTILPTTSNPSVNPSINPSSVPTTNPSSFPTLYSNIEYIILSSLNSSNLKNNNYFIPNQRISFSFSSTLKGQNISLVQTTIEWFCIGCTEKYTTLSENQQNINIYTSSNYDDINAVTNFFISPFQKQGPILVN